MVNRSQIKSELLPVDIAIIGAGLAGMAAAVYARKELMKKIFSGKRPPKYFTELKNFYLIGQWKEPGGGTPPVVRSGRDIIKFIQKKR